MKRIISFVLCLSMLFSMLPVSAFASETEESVIAETAAVETTQAVETTSEATTATEAAESTAATEAPAVTTAPTEAEPAETTAATVAPETVPPETVPAEAAAVETEEETGEACVAVTDMDLPSDEELFAGYAEHVLYGMDISPMGTVAGNKLTGKLKIAYDALVPAIREIAAGNRASTEVTVTLPEASMTMQEHQLLLRTLLGDLPYELYWFDKSCGLAYDRTGYSFTFQFYVTANYSSSGGTRTFEVNTSKTGAASMATATAKALVDKHAAAADWDKLEAYKDEICKLTSYNTSASQNMNFSSNSDPWQLIYVFDNDPHTQVVCEGYSKAFQYLCDLSSFNSRVTCYNVNGSMAGGTGAGAHMWNIVTIGGQNYLADITNSDFGTIGATGTLFLAGGKPNADGSYSIHGVKYIYGVETTELWGDSGILTLATRDFDPDSMQSAAAFMGSVAAGDTVNLNETVALTDDLAISLGENSLNLWEGGELVVPSGVTLTLNSMTYLHGGRITVQPGGKLVLNHGIEVKAAKNSSPGHMEIAGTMTIGKAGSLWLLDGAEANVTGSLRNLGYIHVGANNGGTLNVSHKLSTSGYLAVHPGGVLNVHSEATLNILNNTDGCGYLDNSGHVEMYGTMNLAGLFTTGAATKDGVIVGPPADAEIRGTVNGTATSLFGVLPQGNVLCYGLVTTDGELRVEKDGALWVDDTVTVKGETPMTVLGAVHINHNDKYSTYNGILNLETTANVNGYLDVCSGGVLNIKTGAVLNILSNAAGCGYLDNSGHVGLNGTLNLDGICTTGAATDDKGNIVGTPADMEIRGTLIGSATSSLGVLAQGNVLCYSPVTTEGEMIVEKDGTLWVDSTVTVKGNVPMTAEGNIHISHYYDFCNTPGTLNLETAAEVSGYLAVNPAGTLNINADGTLSVLYYLDNQGKVNISGTLNSMALLSTGGADSVINVNVGGQLNITNNSETAVMYGSTLDVYGKVDIASGSCLKVMAAMNIHGTVTNSGDLYVAMAENGACGWVDLYEGTYTGSSTSRVLVDMNLYGYPLQTWIVDASEQTLVYNGGDPDRIRLVMNYEGYKSQVNITEDLILDKTLVVGEEDRLNILADVTIGEDAAIIAYGPVTVGSKEVPGSVTVKGSINTQHPAGGLTICEGSTVTVSSSPKGVIWNGFNTNVYGNLVINGKWSGYMPVVLENGKVSGTGKPTAFDAFKIAISQAAAGGYPVHMTESITLTEDIALDCELIIEKGKTLTVPAGKTLTVNNRLTNEGNLLVQGRAKLVNNSTVANSGGVVSLSANTYVKGSDSAEFLNCLVGGTLGKVSGISTAEQKMWADIQKESDIQAALTTAAAKGYRNPSLQIARNMTLTGRITLAEGANLTIGDGVNPCTVTMEEQLSLMEGASLTVMPMATLELTASENRSQGTLTVKGSLILDDYCQIYNEGGTITNTGTCQLGTHASVSNSLANGKIGSVQGIPNVYLYAYPNSMADIHAFVAACEEYIYKNPTIYINRDFTITEDVDIPENCTVVVKSASEGGAVLTIAKDVTVNNFGTFTVQPGCNLTVNGWLINEGTATVSSGAVLLQKGDISNRDMLDINGTLQLENNCELHNFGGQLEVAEISGEGMIFDHVFSMAGGSSVVGSVSGVPGAYLHLYTAPANMADLLLALNTFSKGKHDFGTMEFTEDFTITQSITIPEGFTVDIFVDGGVPFAVTIPTGVTVTNEAVINLHDRTELVINGMLEGDMPNMLGGAISGSFLEITQAEFEEMLNAGSDELYLFGSLTLEADTEVTRPIILDGAASIHVPEGKTLTVCDGLLVSGGSLTVDGTLDNQSEIAITSGKIDVNGTYLQEEDWYVFYNARFHEEYPIQATYVEGIDSSYQTLYYDHHDVKLLKAFMEELAGYGKGDITIRGSMTLEDSLQIPADTVLFLSGSEDDAISLTVPQGKTLTNNGTIQIGHNSRLIVNGAYTGNLPNLNHDTAEFIVNGKLDFSQDHLEAQLAAAMETGDTVVLSVPLILTRNLEIPSGVSLFVLSGGKLIIPGGKTLHNCGGLIIAGSGSVIGQSGTLWNEGFLSVDTNGTLDMSNGVFCQDEGNTLIQTFYSDEESAYETTVLGIPAHLIRIEATTCSEDLIGSILAMAAEAEAQGMPYQGLHLCTNGSLTLTRDMTIPENGYLVIQEWNADDKFLVPAGRTLTNNGQIEVHSGGQLIVEAGGTLAGAQPVVAADGIYQNGNGYSQAQLQAALEEAVASGREVLLSSPIVLTDDLTVPGEVSFRITSGGSITIPGDVTLTNNGFIHLASTGAILAEGGMMVNNGTVECRDYGKLDLSGGTYTSASGGTVRKVYWGNAYGDVSDSTVNGIDTSDITMVVQGASEELIHEAIADLAGKTPRYFWIEVMDDTLVLTDDLQLAAHMCLTVSSNGSLVVPNGVTLENQGEIAIHPFGSMTVENGGILLGNQPLCTDPSASFTNENPFTQEDLEELMANALTSGGGIVKLAVPVTVEGALEIPEGIQLTISGYETYITIPSGATLTVNGWVGCQYYGGIRGEGGMLENNGTIRVADEGILDMENGSYAGSGTVTSSHYIHDNGDIVRSTVLGIGGEHLQLQVSGDRQEIFDELVWYAMEITNSSGTAPRLVGEITGDMELENDFWWPSCGTLYIDPDITVTVPGNVTFVNDGKLYVYGKLIVEGSLDSFGTVIAENPGNIVGCEDLTVAVPGVELKEFGLMTDREVLCGDVATLWIDNATENAEVYGYFLQIVSGYGCIGEDGCDSWFLAPDAHVNVWSTDFNDEPDPLVIKATPVIGYDPNGSEIYADELAQTVTITRTTAFANYITSATPAFYEDYGRTIGYYAGTSFTLTGILSDGQGGSLEGTTQIDVACDDPAVTITRKGSAVTVKSSATMKEATVVDILVTPETTPDGIAVAPFSGSILILPKVKKFDVAVDGVIQTRKTITIDLNQEYYDEDGDLCWPYVQLETVTDPADAYSESAIIGWDEYWDPIPQLSWTSSNEDIAEVDEYGFVTFGGNTGKVTITATAQLGTKKTAAITFNVVEMPTVIYPMEGKDLQREDVRDEFGEWQTVYVSKLIGGKGASYTATADFEKALKSNEVIWFLCDENGDAIDFCPYASINASGKLSTKAVVDPFEFYVMARLAGNGNTACLDKPVKVTLYPAVTSASILDESGNVLNSSKISHNLNDSYSLQLSASAAPCQESIKSISWKSSKTTVAEIDEDGWILFDTPGTASITLTVEALDGKKTTASFQLTTGYLAEEIFLSAEYNGEDYSFLDDLTIYSGEKVNFTADVDPADVSMPGITWSVVSAAKNVASISAKGQLTAKTVNNPEVVTVIATSKDGNASETMQVTVLPKPVKINGVNKDALLIQDADDNYLTKATVTLKPGDTMQLFATDDVTWKSASTKAVVIDAETGELEAIAKGTAKITATAEDGRTAEVTIKVDRVAQSLAISTKKNAPFAVGIGKSLNLETLVTYSDGRTDKNAVWSVSDPSAATISTSGALTAAKTLTDATEVTVTAVSKDGYASASVVVEILPLSYGVEIYGPFHASSFDVDVSNTSQNWDMTLQGNTFYLYAGVFPYGALQDVEWKSSSASVATIDRSGKVTCLKPGSVTFTATALDGSGKKASFKLAVTRTMAYLTLPETAEVTAGKSLTMTKLTGYSMDTLATNKTVVWSVWDEMGNPVDKTVATIDARGTLKTVRTLTVPTKVVVCVEATDASNLVAQCVVTIYPA